MRKPIFLGWWQAIVAMINQATGTGALVMSYSVIAVALEKEFSPSREVLMLAMTSLYLMGGVFHPVLGTAMERYSIRKIMLGGVLLLTGGFVAISFATSMIQVIIIYGTAMALSMPAMGPLAYAVQMSRWFVRNRGRAMGIAAMGISIGGVIFPPLMQFLISDFGWRLALRIFAAILFVITVPLITFLIVDRPSDRGLHPDGDDVAPVSAEREDQVQFGSSATVLRNMNFWVIITIITILLSGSGGFISNLVPLAIAKGFTAKQGAYILSSIAIGSFGSMGLFAWIGDRSNPHMGLAGCLIGFALCSFCYLRADTYPLLVAGGLLQGLAIGYVQPLWSLLVSRVFGPAHVGRVYGLMMLVLTPPALLAHPVLGRIYDRTGTYDYGFMAYVGFCLAGLLLVPRIRMGAAPEVPRPAVA